MHLPEIRGELGLLVTPARDILVRIDDLTPRRQPAGRVAFDGGADALPLLGPHLLIEPHTQEFHLHLLGIAGLWRRDGGEQSRHGIERAVGIVAGERILVCPLIADFP